MFRCERIFLLGDLDCFFVEVERLHRPELRGVPVVIGGRPVSRGIVAACSYEARRFGVRSGISMAEAYRRVRQAGEAPFEEGGRIRFLHEGLHGNYTAYSRRVQAIARDMSPVFNAKSVDEFELDLSGCERLFEKQYGGIEGFAHELRRRVRTEVGLPLSTGIGPTRMIAKMASRNAKPDGVFRVLPAQIQAFAGPCDVQEVPGIGPVGAEKLKAQGFHTVSSLLALPPRELERRFGIGILGIVESLVGLRPGEPMAAFGQQDSEQDDMELAPMQRSARPVKSIGHENTFAADQRDPRVLRRMLWRLTEDSCRRLRAKNLRCGHVTVRLRYSDFTTHTHGRALAEPCNSDREIFELACRLLSEADRGYPLRLLGIRLEQLSGGGLQQSLFPREREENFYRAVDSIRGRHGKDMLKSGPGLDHGRGSRGDGAGSTAGIPSAFLGSGQ